MYRVKLCTSLVLHSFHVVPIHNVSPLHDETFYFPNMLWMTSVINFPGHALKCCICVSYHFYIYVQFAAGDYFVRSRLSHGLEDKTRIIPCACDLFLCP